MNLKEKLFFAFLMYLAAVSAVSIIVCAADKSSARKRRRRVPEKVLFLLSAAGGSAAMFFTMIAIRHKTKHKRFMLGLPLMMLLQCAAGSLIYMNS